MHCYTYNSGVYISPDMHICRVVCLLNGFFHRFLQNVLFIFVLVAKNCDFNFIPSSIHKSE